MSTCLRQFLGDISLINCVTPPLSVFDYTWKGFTTLRLFKMWPSLLINAEISCFASEQSYDNFCCFPFSLKARPCSLILMRIWAPRSDLRHPTADIPDRITQFEVVLQAQFSYNTLHKVNQITENHCNDKFTKIIASKAKHLQKQIFS